jgi:hypothetical protein
MGDLPTEPDAKLAMLKRAFEIGKRIGALARVGAPAGPLQVYLAGQPELTVEEGPRRLTARHPGNVRWEVRVGPDGRIEGMGSSGFGPLMEALGIDFSGAPYTAGNGT